MNALGNTDIVLDNRDSLDVRLVKIDTNKYFLKSELEYFGVTYDEFEKVIAIDPPGGPYLAIGSEIIDGLKISKIYHDKELGGFIIETI